MTADVSDVLVVVVLCFFAVTKPASVCNQKKFRNHENNSLQITRQSLIGVVIPLYYSNIRIFFRHFGGLSADKIRRRNRLSAAAWVSNSVKHAFC